MELESAREKFFDEKQLYYQWLRRRSAVPLKLTRFFSIFLWVVAVIFNIMIYTEYNLVPHSYILIVIPPILLALLPIFLTFLYFLYFLPRAIHDDSQSGILEFINASPVPTGDLVSGLRKFFVLMDLRVVIPSIVGFVASLIKDSPFQYFNTEDWVMTGMVISCAVCFLWFIIESGIVAAAMPRIATISGAIILLWILPVLAAIGWGGYKIASFGWNYFLVDIEFYRYNNTTGFNYTIYSLMETIWYMVHYIALLSVITLYLFFNSRMFMDFRRRGRWR